MKFTLKNPNIHFLLNIAFVGILLSMNLNFFLIAPIQPQIPEQEIKVVAGEILKLPSGLAHQVNGIWALKGAKIASSQKKGEYPLTYKKHHTLFQTDRPGEYRIAYINHEGKHGSVREYVKVVVRGNKNPTAIIDEFPRQVKVGSKLHLSASKSFDEDKDPINFSWRIQEAPYGSYSRIKENENVEIDFSPDMVGEYILQLTVRDQYSASNKFVKFTAVEGNTAPIAIIEGPSKSGPGEIIYLSGLNSYDLDKDALKYFWYIAERPEGSQVKLTPNLTTKTSFVPDLPGKYKIGLFVKDVQTKSSTTFKTITVADNLLIALFEAPNNTLIADEIKLVSKNEAIDYQWNIISRPEASKVELDGHQNKEVFFTPDIAGYYIVELVLIDGENFSEPYRKTINVEQENLPPIASFVQIGQTANVGGEVFLNAEGSKDPDGSQLQYFWRLEFAPEGMNKKILVNEGGLLASFRVPMPGEYVISLIVSDGLRDSDPYKLSISIGNVNVAMTSYLPVANAGKDVLAFQTSFVELNGSQSGDALGGSKLKYFWKVEKWPGAKKPFIESVNAKVTNFVAKDIGDYVFSLICTNVHGVSEVDTVLVRVRELKHIISWPEERYRKDGSEYSHYKVKVLNSDGTTHRIAEEIDIKNNTFTLDKDVEPGKDYIVQISTCGSISCSACKECTDCGKVHCSEPNSGVLSFKNTFL